MTVADVDEQKGKRMVSFLMKYCFSHVGLFLLVGGYCVGGAYLFQYIEQQGVVESLKINSDKSFEIEERRKKLADELWTFKWSPTYNETVDNLLQGYQEMVADAIQNHQYTGTAQSVDKYRNGWAFPSALLFTISIVTTIGYGNIWPVTNTGYITVIFYALIGVPLMLMFLANIGEAMARFFRLAYGRGCCYLCWKKRKANYEMNRQLVKDIREGRIAQNPWATEELKAKYANFGKTNKLDDIGDDLPQSRRRHPGSRSGSPVNEKKSDNFSKLENSEKEKEVKKKEKNNSKEEEAMNSYNIYEDIEDPDEEVINVPISLTLVIIAAYLFLGAVMFAAWNNWTWITGAYFSFVTLSTIGFGDLIPGWDEVGTTTGNIKMAVSCFYIVFGLAVVSMSFNLMMEEMIAKFQWLGRKLGIIDDPNVKKNAAKADDKRPLVVDNNNDGDNVVVAGKNSAVNESAVGNRPLSVAAKSPTKFTREETRTAADEMYRAAPDHIDSAITPV